MKSRGSFVEKAERLRCGIWSMKRIQARNLVGDEIECNLCKRRWMFANSVSRLVLRVYWLLMNSAAFLVFIWTSVNKEFGKCIRGNKY